jgi:VWFA-related protein
MFRQRPDRARRWATALIAPLLAAPVPLAAQARETTPKSSPERYTAVSEAVVLDVVVRDRRGRLITDLRPEEFHVYENGREQVIRSARLVTSGGGGHRSTAALEVSGQRHHPISLVFDALSLEGRRYARQAVIDLLRSDLPANFRIGVFAIDKGLRPVAPYSADLQRIREAAELATSGSFEQIRARARELYEELTRPAPGVETLTPEAALTLRVLEAAPAMETELRGQEVVDALRALVSAQPEAGRKTVIFFSEGLYLPEKLTYLFQLLINQANHFHTSIYAVDARGLISQAQGQAGAQALGAAASSSQAQVQSGGVGSLVSSPAAGLTSAQSEGRGRGPVGPEEMRSLETAGDSVRMNVQEALDTLSRRTGGFLTANTNDPSDALQKLAAEIQQYYELHYVPEADSADPAYRQIRVTVDREGATVQTRDGYFPSSAAVRAAAADQLRQPPWEVPLTEVLERGEPPRDFTLRSLSFHFGHRGGKAREVMAAAVPLGELQIDRRESRYSAHVSILAVVRAEDGTPVARFSQDFPMAGGLEDLESLLSGEVVLLRSFEAPPGRYRVEIAAYDHLAGKASARRQVLVVEPPADQVRLSSLLLVRALEPLGEFEALLESPLHHAGHRIIPYAGTELGVAPGTEIPVYCQIYPHTGQSPEGETEPVRLTVAVLRGGEPLFQGTPELVSGPSELEALFTIPTADLAPGTYELRAWAEQEGLTAVRSAVFTLAPPRR